MKTRDLLEVLEPKGYGSSHLPEPWPEYLARVQPLIPNFPDQVIEQWLYRHYSDAVSDYGWLGLETIEWTLERWITGRIAEAVRGFRDDGLIDHWTDHFKNNREGQEGWLATFMAGNATWPVPIMIIHNPSGLVRPDGLALASPYHLMEGHHRLGFLRALEEDERRQSAPEHDVFVARVDVKTILDFWPLNDCA